MLQQINVDAEPGVPADVYIVHLPSFEGPLDLLLHLIEKRQMEITTISLVAVTDQYLAYLQRWQVEQMPLANMAAFISVATRLLFIKSQNLLPRDNHVEATDEAQSAVVLAEELQQHLREYKQAREIAAHLRHREEVGLQTFARSGVLAGIEAHLNWAPPTLIGLEAQALAHAFHNLLALQAEDGQQGTIALPIARVRVSECIAEILGHLQRQECISLADVLQDEHSLLVIIVTFLAVLELWKWQRINVTQDDLMAPITLERGERWGENVNMEENPMG